MIKHLVLQTQHRIKLHDQLNDYAAEGWLLVGPVQFTVFQPWQQTPDGVQAEQPRTYYCATLQREEQDEELLQE